MRLLWARRPEVFNAPRGRPRRWYDPSEELLVQQVADRRRLRALLASVAAGDVDLARVLARVDSAERMLRHAIRVGALLTVAFLGTCVVFYRLDAGA